MCIIMPVKVLQLIEFELSLLLLNTTYVHIERVSDMLLNRILGFTTDCGTSRSGPD